MKDHNRRESRGRNTGSVSKGLRAKIERESKVLDLLPLSEFMEVPL